MDIKAIYVINNNEYTRQQIREILKEEGYSHDFYFANENEFNSSYLKFADEVWCFGDCGKIKDYHVAMESRKDIWQMG